jgi:hypothetical protein
MPADPTERFIVIEQTKPTHWRTIIQPGAFDSVLMMPCKYEVIDRGADFVPLQPTYPEFVVLARFTNLHDASELRKRLTGEK